MTNKTMEEKEVNKHETEFKKRLKQQWLDEDLSPREMYLEGFREGKKQAVDSNNKRLIKLVEGMFPEKETIMYFYTRGVVKPNDIYKEAKQDLLNKLKEDYD
jgi:hypothetical protein